MADLTDASKDVETVEEQILCLEKSLSNNQFSKNHAPVQDELKTIGTEIFLYINSYWDRKFKKVQAEKLMKSNKSKKNFREIAFLAVLNFFPVQKLIFGHF